MTCAHVIGSVQAVLVHEQCLCTSSVGARAASSEQGLFRRTLPPPKDAPPTVPIKQKMRHLPSQAWLTPTASVELKNGQTLSRFVWLVMSSPRMSGEETIAQAPKCERDSLTASAPCRLPTSIMSCGGSGTVQAVAVKAGSGKGMVAAVQYTAQGAVRE
jgi:hypothetical protein